MNPLPRAALAILVLLTAGCGVATTGVSPQSEIASAIDQVQEDPAAGAVDACVLLPDAEVEALIGSNGGPVPSPPVGDGGRCGWENTQTYHSVTVDIGSTGTAASGLPAWDDVIGPEMPLPDDMRSWGGGQVEFVAGGRQCFVQVVTADLGGDSDEQEAIRLARTVRDQL